MCGKAYWPAEGEWRQIFREDRVMSTTGVGSKVNSREKLGRTVKVISANDEACGRRYDADPTCMFKMGRCLKQARDG